MARKANYDVKIEALEAKIDKKHAEIKALKQELAELQGKKKGDSMKDLYAFMEANGMSASDVLAMIQ